MNNLPSSYNLLESWINFHVLFLFITIYFVDLLGQFSYWLHSLQSGFKIFFPMFKRNLCYLSTNSSNPTLRLPTIHQDSSSRAHFVSMKQSYSYFVDLLQVDSSHFYESGISSSCKASLLQHSLHKDLVCQLEYHSCVRKDPLFNLLEILLCIS